MSSDLLIDLSVLFAGLVVPALGILMRRRSSIMIKSIGLAALVLGASAVAGAGLRAAPLVLARFSEGPTAEPPRMSNRQRELILLVMQGEEVSPGLHEEFWRPLRDAGLSDRQLSEFRNQLTGSEGLLAAQRYQREGWRCARQSYESGRLFRSDSLESLERELLQSASASPAGLRGVEKAVGHMRLLLEAAASHGTLAIPDRDDVLITAELIESVESSIDETFERLDRLFEPRLLERK